MPEPVDLNFVTTDVLGGSVLQWATPFTDVKDLVDKAIAKLKPGQCIRRLVIAGHGADHTDGFFVFDPDTSGAQLIDGGTKRQPISPSVVTQLRRLKTHFCKDAIIEFRVCRFGEGTNGQKAMQAVADAVGVPVTAQMGSISSLALIGGLATDWRVAYPVSWGMATSTSFWRGEPTRPPQGAPLPGDIAPITGQVVPLRSVPGAAPGAANNFLTPPAALPPIRKVSIANPSPGPVSRAVAVSVVGAVVLAGLVIGWLWSNSPATPGPTATPTTAPTATPTTRPTPTPTPTPSAAPTPTPSAAPTPSSVAVLVPPDGDYRASGMFTSYDGQESFQSAWLVSIAGDDVEISQLLQPGGAPFRVTPGVLDPAGLVVAVNKDPAFCDVLVLGFANGQWSDELFVAYGPATMTCPDGHELAPFYLTLPSDPLLREAALRNAFGWGPAVVVGSVATGGWPAD